MRIGDICHEDRGLSHGRTDLESERWVLVEDPLLQIAQVRRRIKAHLSNEVVARLLVCAQCLGLASAPVEGKHLLSAEPLAKRMLFGERLEFGDQLPVISKFQVRIHTMFDRRHPELAEACPLRREMGEAVNIGIRMATPQSQSFSERLRPLLGVARSGCLGKSILEYEGIDIGTVGIENVARPARLDDLAQFTTQIRHIRLNRTPRTLRWLVTVDAVNKEIR